MRITQPSSLPVVLLPGAHFLIVQAQFNEDVGALLLHGASNVLDAAGVTYTLVRVPGALEIPAAITIALHYQPNIEGVVAIGCVIRGETFHFEIVAGESARALMDVSVTRRLPLGNGIITAETHAQAMERANPERMNKGGEAAHAALVLANLNRGVGA